MGHVPPFTINGLYIGANHGSQGRKVTASAHGKTSADIGSVWVDEAGKRYDLLRIIDANIDINIEHISKVQSEICLTLYELSTFSNVLSYFWMTAAELAEHDPPVVFDLTELALNSVVTIDGVEIAPNENNSDLIGLKIVNNI